MTTYNVSFSLAEAQTGVSGHYPLLIKNSTYIPDSTLYVKTGDIVQYTVTEPNGLLVTYNNTTVSDTNPDPSNSGTNPRSSGSTWSYTVGTDSEDALFDWYWFSQTVHSSGSGRAFSQRVRTRRVEGAPKMNGGTSAITVNPGNTITFSVSNLNGLAAKSGNGNFLYFSIFPPTSTTVPINPHSYTGGGWEGTGTGVLGRIDTTDTDTILTLGSNFPLGTYSVFLTHFNAADSPAGNDFYGSEHRLGADGVMGNSASALQFTVQAPPDTNPNAFAFTNATTTRSTDASSSVTLAGMGGASTVTAITSGFTATANGTAISAGSAVPQNATIVLSTTSSNTYGATVTGSIQIGTTTSTNWVVTTEAAPAAGSAASGVSGTSAYGVAILKPGAATQIFNQNMRVTNLIATGNVSLSKNGAGNVDSSNITIPDTIISTTSAYAILYHVVSSTVREDRMFPIVDTSNNNFKFRLQNITGNVSATAYWSFVRY